MQSPFLVSTIVFDASDPCSDSICSTLNNPETATPVEESIARQVHEEPVCPICLEELNLGFEEVNLDADTSSENRTESRFSASQFQQPMQSTASEGATAVALDNGLFSTVLRTFNVVGISRSEPIVAPCSHTFHTGCLVLSLTHALHRGLAAACPLCRAPIHLTSTASPPQPSSAQALEGSNAVDSAADKDHGEVEPGGGGGRPQHDPRRWELAMAAVEMALVNSLDMPTNETEVILPSNSRTHRMWRLRRAALGLLAFYAVLVFTFLAWSKLDPHDD